MTPSALPDGLVAGEMLDGREDQLLAGFRPNRFDAAAWLQPGWRGERLDQMRCAVTLMR